jgi:hypothetical protein
MSHNAQLTHGPYRRLELCKNPWKRLSKTAAEGDMTEYGKCQNLTRLTQLPRWCQDSKMVLKDSSTKMIRTKKKTMLQF